MTHSNKEEETGRLIGRGKAARVYKLDGPEHVITRKEFSPILPVVMWNWFFYDSPHPLTTKTGFKYSYWKRRIASRLCRFYDPALHIPDALKITETGFIAEYVHKERYCRRAKRIFYPNVRSLEKFFGYLGLPTWSFSRRNPFSASNFVFGKDKVYIVDYEQSVPVKDPWGVIDYDRIYFDDLRDYVSGNNSRLRLKLGNEEFENLKEAMDEAERCQDKLDIRPKKTTKLVNKIRSRRAKR